MAGRDAGRLDAWGRRSSGTLAGGSGSPAASTWTFGSRPPRTLAGIIRLDLDVRNPLLAKIFRIALDARAWTPETALECRHCIDIDEHQCRCNENPPGRMGDGHACNGSTNGTVLAEPGGVNFMVATNPTRPRPAGPYPPARWRCGEVHRVKTLGGRLSSRAASVSDEEQLLGETKVGRCNLARSCEGAGGSSPGHPTLLHKGGSRVRRVFRDRQGGCGD